MKTSKKRLLLTFSILLSIAIIFLGILFFNPKSDTDDDGFSGTETLAAAPDTVWYTRNPAAVSFDIDTADKLAGLASLVNSGNNFNNKTIILTADIDLKNAGYLNWTPIGNVKGRPFSGTFDGNNKKIDNLNITTAQTYSGLFGVIGGSVSTTIKNLVLENVKISVSDSSDLYAGAVAAYVEGEVTIQNVKVESGSVKGIAAKNQKYCRVGGIIGYALASRLIITKSYNKANININFGYAGGLVGSMLSPDNSNINNSFNEGAITIESANESTNAYIGGILGGIEIGNGQITIEDCYNIGDVKSNKSSGSADMAGGIVGQNNLRSGTNNKLVIRNCFNAGNVSKSKSEGMGGLVGGGTVNINIENSYHNHTGGSNDSQGTYKENMLEDPGFADMLNNGRTGDDAPYNNNAPYGFPSLKEFGSGIIIGITFDLNYEGAQSPVTIGIESGKKLTKNEIAVPERKIPNNAGEAEFLEWNTDKDGNGDWYKYDSVTGDLIDEVTLQGLHGITLYAQWKILYNFTVTFNYENSSGVPQSKSYTKLQNEPNGSITITKSEMILIIGSATGTPNDVKNNEGKKVFTEWKDASENSYPYDINGNINVSKSVTLYAQWSFFKKITVTYTDLNGLISNNIYEDFEDENGEITIPASAIPNPGVLDNNAGKWEFLGWSTEPESSNPDDWYGGNSTKDIVAIKDTTLYAQWKKTPYITVTFIDEYSGTPVTIGATKILKGNPITKTNIAKPSKSMADAIIKFIKWTDKAGMDWGYDENGNLVDSGNKSPIINDAVTMYAVWETEVIFRFDDGTSVVSVTIKVGEELLLGIVPAKPGPKKINDADAEFDVWTAIINGVAVSYEYDDNGNIVDRNTKKQIVLVTEHFRGVQFSAQWKIIEFITVSFFVNYSPATETIPPVYGVQAIGIFINRNEIPVPADRRADGLKAYEFLGWSESPNGVVLYIYSNGTFDKDIEAASDIMLYAKWNPIPLASITFVDNSSIIDEWFRLPGYELKQSDINAIPKRNNVESGGLIVKRFLGWSETQDGNVIDESSLLHREVTALGLTFYAIWEDWFIVTFYYNEANTIYDRFSAPSGNISESVIKKSLERYEAVFTGWKDAGDSEYKFKNGYLVDSIGERVGIAGDMTFYAQWSYYIEITFIDDYDSGNREEQTIRKLPGDIIIFDELKEILMSNKYYSGSNLIAAEFFRWETEGGTVWYQFVDGKLVDKDGNIVTISDGMPLEILLYAAWKNYVKITFIDNYNSSNLTIKKISKLPGTTIETGDLPSNLLNKEDNEKLILARFQGWEGGGTTVAGDDMVFYAKWELYIRLIFDYNDGSTKSLTINKPLGDIVTFNETKVPYRFGASFAAWNTEIDGSGSNPFANGDITLIEELNRITYYASWNLTQYHIETDAAASPNGTLTLNGTKNPLTIEDFNKYIDLSIEAEASDNYVFGSWQVKNKDGQWISLTQFKNAALNIGELFDKKFLQDFFGDSDSEYIITFRAIFNQTGRKSVILKIASLQESYGWVETDDGNKLEYGKEINFYFVGDTINLRAVSKNRYYEFVGFRINGGNPVTAIESFELTKDTVIDVEFREASFNISVLYQYLSGESFNGKDVFGNILVNLNNPIIKVGYTLQIECVTDKPGYRFSSLNGKSAAGKIISVSTWNAYRLDNSGAFYLLITEDLLNTCLNNEDTLELLVLYSEQYKFNFEFKNPEMYKYSELEVYITDSEGNERFRNIASGDYVDKGMFVRIDLPYDANGYELLSPDFLLDGFEIIEIEKEESIIINLKANVYNIYLDAQWFEGAAKDDKNGITIENMGFSVEKEFILEYNGSTEKIDRNPSDLSGYEFLGWRIWDWANSRWVDMGSDPNYDFVNNNNNLDRMYYAGYLENYAGGDDGVTIKIIAEYMPVYTLSLKAEGPWQYEVKINGEEVGNLEGQYRYGTTFEITVKKSVYIDFIRNFSGFKIIDIEDIIKTETDAAYVFAFTLNKDLIEIGKAALVSVSFDFKPIIKTFNINLDLSKAEGDMTPGTTGTINGNIIKAGLNDSITFRFNLSSTQVIESWTVNGEKVEDLVKRGDIAVFYDGSILRLNLDEATLNWLGDKDISILITTKFDPLLLASIIGGGISGLLVLVCIVIISMALIKKQKKIKAAREAGVIGAARFKVANVVEDAINFETDKKNRK